MKKSGSVSVPISTIEMSKKLASVLFLVALADFYFRLSPSPSLGYCKHTEICKHREVS